jgi:hypothetical protein
VPDVDTVHTFRGNCPEGHLNVAEVATRGSLPADGDGEPLSLRTICSCGRPVALELDQDVGART